MITLIVTPPPRPYEHSAYIVAAVANAQLLVVEHDVPGRSIEYASSVSSRTGRGALTVAAGQRETEVESNCTLQASKHIVNNTLS